MRRLVNDANIFIDLEEADLLETLFQLPYEFVTPDALFEEELQSHHGHLLQLGLGTLELQAARMVRLHELLQRHEAIGFMDCLALALAEQERCPLLTGDRKLRDAAETEGLDVHGTLWVVESLLEHQIIRLEQAYAAYDRMENAQRRLPYRLARCRLRDRFGPRQRS